MLERESNNSTLLDFAERPMTSATEIYKPKGIPTGETMPEYTRTQTTSQPICIDPAEQVQTWGEWYKESLRLRSLTPQGRSEYFRNMQRKHEPLVCEYYIELVCWQMEKEAMKMRPPTCADYNDKLKELYKLFKEEIKKEFPIEKYFAHGPDDDEYAGLVLIMLALKGDSAVIGKAVKYLSGIQWLIRERDKLPFANEGVPTTDQSATNEITAAIKREEHGREQKEHQELLDVYMELNLGDKNRTYVIAQKERARGDILTTIRHMYKADDRPWADNASKFSQELVTVLPDTKNLSHEEKKKKAKAIAKSMTRICDLKKLHLQELSVDNIMEQCDCYRSKAESIYKKWEGLYSHVLKCRDNVRKRKGDKKEGTEETRRDMERQKETESPSQL